MEKNKIGSGKTRCVCTEDSEESLNEDSEHPKVPTFEEVAETLKKHLEKNEKCICTHGGQVKNRVSWVDEAEDKPSECICESLNTSPPSVYDDISSTSAIPQEEPRKKKKSFGQTLKYIVTCAWCKQSDEPKPGAESEPAVDYEDVATKDSDIISLLGRTYSEVSHGKDDWKKEPLVLVFDVPENLPRKVKTRERMQERPSTARSREMTEDVPVKAKRKEVREELPVKPKIKEVTEEKPVKPKIKEVIEEKPVKVKIKEAPQDIPAKQKIKEVQQEKPIKQKIKEIPQDKPTKPKTKDLTPKVSFAKPLPKKKESQACICTGSASPKYASKSSSRVSTTSSKVKCKCSDPEETPSGQLIATKCVCGQLTPSEASLASGYTIGSKASKPDCCYPEKSEELLRKIEYQRPSQYSYSRYDQPLQTYGLEAPSIRSVYTPSTVSFADSNLYMPEEDDISLNETASRYSYRKSTSVLPSRSISETAAGPSQPPTLYQRFVKRFWLESILYRDPYEPPSRVQSAPSYVSDVSLHRPPVKYKTEVKKPTPKSKEKVCGCSKVQLVACSSKDAKQKATLEIPKVQKPKTETTQQCVCAKKSSETVSIKSKEVLVSPRTEECHCLEVLYMSRSSSKTDETVLTKTASDVSPGTSNVERKTKNVPTIAVTPAEETEAKLADEKGSKSSSNSSVVTVIDTHALQLPSVFGPKPVDVKKSEETQEQVASDSSAENPETTPPPLANDRSGWWDKSKHLIIGSTVVGATAIGAYQYFKD